MDGVCDGIRYWVLFGSEKYDSIYHRIRYLIGIKSGIKYVIFHNNAKIKVDSFGSLPPEKTMTFHNVLILTSQFRLGIKIIFEAINLLQILI